MIHAREADDDTARILEEEMGKGPFPAVLHCYTGGPDLARRAIALGLLDLVHRHRDIQEFRGAARDRQERCRRIVFSSRPTRRISRPAVSRQAQRAGLRR